MALTFPADKSDFTAQNGITYTWDNEDGKWRVKAFRSQDDFLVVVGDTPPDEAKEGDLWWDSSPDSLTLFVYEGSAWVPAAPPVSLDGINATIDAALIVQNDLLDRVQSGELAQATLQDTVADALDLQTTLENRIEALEGTVIDGTWTLDNRSIAREGHFIGLGLSGNTTDWTEVIRLQFHPTDLNGKVFTFAEVSIDDVVRIGGVGGSAAYKITSSATQQGDVYEFNVTLLSHTGVMAETLTYEFEFLNAFDPSAYATIQYVDAQDDLDVKLAAANDVTTGFRIKSDGKTLISTATAGELGLYHVKDPTNQADSWAANKGYVDSKTAGLASEDYVDDAIAAIPDADLSGHLSKTGQQDLNAAVWKIRQPNADGNFRSFISIEDGSMNLYNVADPSDGNDGWGVNRGYVKGNYVGKTGTQTLSSSKWLIQQADENAINRNFIEIENENMKLFHVQDCTDGNDAWAANKGYVDTKTAGLASETYVDDAIAAIPAPTAGVPVGSIMIWMNSTAPDGWFKLQGDNFDIAAYPKLHAYLQGTFGYFDGRLPNWSGHYPGEYGDHLNDNIGKKKGYQTAKPSGGSPKSSARHQDAQTDSANQAGAHAFPKSTYSQVTIDQGWDSTTRPKTVIVHYIIKHD